MTQEDVIQAFRSGHGRYQWIPLPSNEFVQVMARPARIGQTYVAVSARTAQHCADILSECEWTVSLSTVAIEDQIWAAAAAKPPPLLISPRQMNIASPAALAGASAHLSEVLTTVADDVLVAYGKTWVADPALAAHPGRAANYGMPDPSGLYLSASGAYKLWQPLGFAHDADHFDYSQLLRLVRVRRGGESALYGAAGAAAGAANATAPVARLAAVAAPIRGLRVLHQGLSGEDVTRWQQFLLGRGLYQAEVDGRFGAKLDAATREFQRGQGLEDDGWVGNRTWGRAIELGLGVVTQPHAPHDGGGSIASGEDGPGWPSAPPHLHSLSVAERSARFGAIEYVPAPVPNMREAIRITNGFTHKHIVTVALTELAGISGASASGNITLHHDAVEPCRRLWKAWADAGLRDRILTFDGAWVPRTLRGRTDALSSHAWGTAFDINAQWNGFGQTPIRKGKRGSVRELVGIANDHGWYWGGHFGSRLDGMHFEYCG